MASLDVISSYYCELLRKKNSKNRSLKYKNIFNVKMRQIELNKNFILDLQREKINNFGFKSKFICKYLLIFLFKDPKIKLIICFYI